MCRLCGRIVRCIFDSMPSRSLSLPTRHITSSAHRAHLFTRRVYSISILRLADEQSTSLFNRGPHPRLPKQEQDLFEQLQAQSTGAFSTLRAAPRINQSPDSSVADKAQAETEINERVSGLTVAEQEDVQSKSQAKTPFQDDYKKIIEARGKGEELHPNVRRGRSQSLKAR